MLCRYRLRQARKDDARPRWWKGKGPPPSAAENLKYQRARREWARKDDRFGVDPLTFEQFRRGRHLRRD